MTISGRSNPYPYFITKGRMMALARIAGIGTSHRLDRRRYPSAAPISVAMLPKMTSVMMAPANRFPSRQPTKSPGIADGVKSTRIVSTSATRICPGPKEIGEKISVSTM